MRVDIWSDLVCPWCYLGKRRFEKALSQTKCPVPISEVRLSPHPTQATAKGAYIAAVYDN